jgi:prepilin-type processing-associated H-X9-DG protein
MGLGGQLDMETVAGADPFGGRPQVRRVHVEDLAPDPQVGASGNTRLDWVGRNHGKNRKSNGIFNEATSNFLYADGHVETKSIRDTVQPDNFEWGERFYSWEGGGSIVR